MSFTVKSLVATNQTRNVESAGKASRIVSDMQTQGPGAILVEIHPREGDGISHADETGQTRGSDTCK